MRIGIFTETLGIFENLQFYLEKAGHEVVHVNPYEMPKDLKVDGIIIDPDIDRTLEIGYTIHMAPDFADGNAVLYAIFPPDHAHRQLQTVHKREAGKDVPHLLEALGFETS